MDETKKLDNLEDVVKFCEVNQFPADIVGSWVWIKFESKPPTSDRDLLKSAGFRWVPRRGEWAHNCGRPSRNGKTPPRFKYGAVPVSSGAARDEDGPCSDSFISEFERGLQQEGRGY